MSAIKQVTCKQCGSSFADYISFCPNCKAYVHSETTKDTNPKDGIGATKLPLSMIPAVALAHQSLAHLDGASKYGKWNWRVAGVRASIYVDATIRHITAYNEGEDTASDSGVHHLGHAIACLNILLDAASLGKLIDDRPPSGFLSHGLTGTVKMIQENHKDKSPRHYTIQDTDNGLQRNSNQTIPQQSRNT